MSEYFRIEISVDETAVDLNGHVNNVCFVQWMQDVAVAHATSYGITKDFYDRHSSTWVARSHHVEYIKPAFAGDLIEVETWLASKRKISCLRKYRFTRVDSGDLLTKAQTEWVYVNAQTGRPQKIHSDIIDKFRFVDERVAESSADSKE